MKGDEWGSICRMAFSQGCYFAGWQQVGVFIHSFHRPMVMGRCGHGAKFDIRYDLYVS